MNSATQTQVVKKESIKDYIDRPDVRDRVEKLLKKRADQFVMTITSMVANNVKLQDCEPSSLFTAAVTIVAMDLPVNSNLGFAWIIPYQDRKTGKTYAQAQLGYKAFIQLAMRSDKFKTLNVSDVRQGEYKGLDRLSGELDLEWNEDTEQRNKLPVVGYVAYMRLKNGFEKSYYMTAQEARLHGQKYSQNFKRYNSGMWADEFDAMAKKTVIKLMLSKYAPMSTDMARAQEVDQGVIQGDSISYLDNQKQTAAEISEEKEQQRLIKYIKSCRTLKSLQMCKSSCTTNETAELYKEKEKKLLARRTEIEAKLVIDENGKTIAVDEETGEKINVGGQSNGAGGGAIDTTKYITGKEDQT